MVAIISSIAHILQYKNNWLDLPRTSMAGSDIKNQPILMQDVDAAAAAGRCCCRSYAHYHCASLHAMTHFYLLYPKLST